MAITAIERFTDPLGSLDSASVALAACAQDVGQAYGVLAGHQAMQFIVGIEQISRTVDHLQILAARLAEENYTGEIEDASEAAPAGSFGTTSLLARAEQAACESVPSRSWPDTTTSDPSSSDAALPEPASSCTASSCTGGTAWDPRAGGSGFRDCGDFLRATLGISRAEAKRRLALAGVLLPTRSPTGAAIPPRLAALGAATNACLISARAATIVSQTVQRVESFTTPQQLESMEHHLTRQAIESDEDILRVLAHRWENVLDQDGQEPTQKVLRARQGVFLKGRRHGLHVLEIGATNEQFEHLITVMNSTANPRTPSGQADATENTENTGNTGNTDGADGADRAGAAHDAQSAAGPMTGPGADSGADPGAGADPGSGAGSGAGFLAGSGGATRAQSLLEGLVAACRIALTTAALPATGGHRPQVMVTIDYKDLIGNTQHPGHAVFTEQLSARNIRQLACDADIIPLVLGSKGQILDIGRAQRLFPPHLRRALVARDKGCAFPDCSIPASWCEAHHMTPWSRGGTTGISNGVLLCSRHHHLIHQGQWTVEPRQGIPWFHAPGHPGRSGTPRQNRYRQAGQIVHDQLTRQPPPHQVHPG